MSVRRAIPVVRTADVAGARSFYGELLGFDVGMEQEGMDMYVSSTVPTTQVIVAATAGPVADEVVGEAAMSVEVADVRSVYAEAQRQGLEIVHPLTDEAWGITRFFVRDPGGTVVNVTTHTADLA